MRCIRDLETLIQFIRKYHAWSGLGSWCRWSNQPNYACLVGRGLGIASTGPWLTETFQAEASPVYRIRMLSSHFSDEISQV